MIELVNVNRSFGETVKALSNINLYVRSGEFVSIIGPSGSGKSTLLGIMAGLDRPSSGDINLDGNNITSIKEKKLAQLRSRLIGFIFQNYQLIPSLTALENIMVPAELLGQSSGKEIKERARALLHRIGLESRGQHYPSQLSGGESQRVAIARALVCEPKVIFADEPTGNLDSKNGEIILKLLLELQGKATLILVTHNPALANLAQRQIQLRDGFIEDIINPNSEPTVFENLKKWLRR